MRFSPHVNISCINPWKCQSIFYTSYYSLFMPIFILTLLFLLHGIVYFWYPEAVLIESSPLKLIKYIILILAISFTFYKDLVTAFYASFIFVFFLTLGMIAQNFSFDSAIIKYLTPLVSAILLYKPIISLSKSRKKIIALATYILGIIFSIFEHSNESISLSPYSTGLFGERVSSIFVNPNNFAITMLFILIYLLENTHKKIIKIVYILLYSIVLVLSFSKTAILLTLVYITYRFFFIVLPILLIAASYFIASSKHLFGSFSFDSLVARHQYNDSFRYLIEENLLFPFFNNYQYTDNNYLNIYGNFGLVVIILLILMYIFIFAILLSKRKYDLAVILILFLITMYSTNILYLWPIGYFHWFFIFYCYSLSRSTLEKI